MRQARQHQAPKGRTSGGMMAELTALLWRRGGSSGWPALDGFSSGPTLALPAGEVFAQEGVQLLTNTKLGDRVEPSCEEAWIAGRDGQECWYAVWCPYADRWEILRFELAQPARAAARREQPQVRGRARA